MSADKRSMVGFDNPENFPGKINVEKNRFESPTLYKTASTGKVRQWTMYCRLIKEDSKAQSETKKQNWNTLLENEVPIKQEYLRDDNKIPLGTISEIWSESGLMTSTMSRSPATYILVPKNLGKKNERSVLHQALVIIRGKHLKKIDDGSINELGDIMKDVTINTSTKLYPMLAKKYEDFVNKKKSIKYPIYVQPKLDGNRCIAFLDTNKSPTYKNVIMYTRSQKEYPNNPPNDAIRKALLDVLIKYYDNDNKESLFLDGELYIHNKSLQEINSEVRGQSLDANISIQYWVYDHFYPKYTNESFGHRHSVLNSVYKDIATPHRSLIILVKTDLIKSEAGCDTIYKKYLSDNYEGIMVRSPEGIYLKSPIKKSEQLRSKDLLKRKETYDDEFEVVDYKDGKNGKEIGAVIWICKAKNKNSDTFSATPNLPIKERYAIFKECQTKFDTKYKGRLITIEYRGLSDNCIPLQSKAVGFRDII